MQKKTNKILYYLVKDKIELLIIFLMHIDQVIEHMVWC
jgi:hypothetical protein